MDIIIIDASMIKSIIAKDFEIAPDASGFFFSFSVCNLSFSKPQKQ
jgi:hypothetical protein